MTATDRSSLESQLTAWFAETAVPMTLDDIDPIAELTAGVRQRPVWPILERWLPMRTTTMTRPTRGPTMRTVAVLAALLILAAAALVATRIGSQAPQPVFGSVAANGVIAYGRDGDIVVADPETGAERTLVGGSEQDAAPVFSWDGQQVAFTREVDGSEVLLVMPAAGGEPRTITPEPLDIVGPTWSFDGAHLAFTNGDLVVASADGSGFEVLALPVRAEKVRWRPPDGTQLSFTHAGDGVSLYLVNRDGTGLAPLAFADGTAVQDGVVGWTTDGTRLVTTREVAVPDGGRRALLHVLTVGSDGVVAQDSELGPELVAGPYGVALSPEGRRVVVPAAETVGGDGWRATILTLDGSASPIVTEPTFVGEDFQLAWSPDGRSVVVLDEGEGVTWLLSSAAGPGRAPERQASWHDPSGSLLSWQRVLP